MNRQQNIEYHAVNKLTACLFDFACSGYRFKHPGFMNSLYQDLQIDFRKDASQFIFLIVF